MYAGAPWCTRARTFLFKFTFHLQSREKREENRNTEQCVIKMAQRVPFTMAYFVLLYLHTYKNVYTLLVCEWVAFIFIFIFHFYDKVKFKVFLSSYADRLNALKFMRWNCWMISSMSGDWTAFFSVVLSRCSKWIVSVTLSSLLLLIAWMKLMMLNSESTSLHANCGKCKAMECTAKTNVREH